MADERARAAGAKPGQSVTQTGYETFQAALLDGRLRPGQMVSQRELVDMLSLSIGALRELLPRLQSEGLVLVRPQRGVQIPAIDLPMIRNAFQIRAALEREAVLHAVRTMPDELLLEQREKHLSILEQVETATGAGVFERGQDVDAGLHSLLIRATGNELLIRAYSINNIRIRLIRLDRILLSRATLPAAFRDHLAVIDAILARNLHGAMDAMDRHIANARTRATEL
ncbi:MAG: GntR family transcriptional regulator [Tropicimonas sp.]|uniref:GntR family transcriptional regulator n=1 Tax=Tropicimonas sp. TaxID=2067044 RepID=UPI003A85687D